MTFKIYTFSLLFKISLYFFIFILLSDIFDLQRSQPLVDMIKDFIYPLDNKNNFNIIRCIFLSHEEFETFLLQKLNYSKKNSKTFENVSEYMIATESEQEDYYLRDLKQLKTYYICYIFNDFCLQYSYLPYVVDILFFQDKSLKLIKDCSFENCFQKELFNNFCLDKGKNTDIKFKTFEEISVFDFDNLVDRPILRLKKMREIIIKEKND